MKIAVFGGSGGTGTNVLRQSLERDYEINALIRSPEKLELRQPGLNVIKGDVMDSSAVASTISGSDAVVSTLGAAGLGKTTLYSESIRNIIQGMNVHGVRRLLCVSAVGVDPRPDTNIPLLGRLITKLLLKNVFADMLRMEQHIETTDLEWTIMWPPMLTAGALTGNYRTSPGRALPKGSKISRADLAHFMVTNIENPDYYRQKVTIAY